MGFEPYYNRLERRLMLAFVRNAIAQRLGKPLKETVLRDSHKLDEKRGVFVTLHLDRELRGCIGYPLPVKTLRKALEENAEAAAFHDPRFPPLSAPEFATVAIEISVLTLPREVDSADQVTVGQDGIIISTPGHKGLLLPQVPVEQGWDHDSYLDYGCYKAGLSMGYWRSHPVKIETFQAEVFNEEGENEPA